MAALDQQYLAKLVDFSRRGDSDAFAELYIATCQEQYHFAYGYLKDEELAQDALRNTYIFALKNISSLADVNLFLPWLSQIMLRTCLDEKAAYIQSEEPFSPRKHRPEEEIVLVEGESFRLQQILNLPFTESIVIILKYFDSLKIWEIAWLTNMRRRVVKHYLDSGCKKLQQLTNR